MDWGTRGGFFSLGATVGILGSLGSSCPALVGSPVHKPLHLCQQLGADTLCRASLTRLSVLYEVALRKSFKPRDWQTQIQVSAQPLTLCMALTKILVLTGAHFLYLPGYQQTSEIPVF